jgi:hypothetical protein
MVPLPGGEGGRRPGEGIRQKYRLVKIKPDNADSKEKARLGGLFPFQVGKKLEI